MLIGSLFHSFTAVTAKVLPSFGFTRVFRASQGYASMPRLSRRNITNPCQCIGQILGALAIKAFKH